MKKPQANPPRLADRFLKWYCSDRYFEEVQGDLHEWFYQRTEEEGLFKARLYYYLDVVRYFRSFRLKSTQKINNNSKYLSMKSLFKITFRNLRRSGFSTLLRVGNLSLGIVIFMLTLVYTRYELSYDTFHNEPDNIYRTGQIIRGNAWAAAPLGMGAFVRDNISEVEHMTRVWPIFNSTIKRGDVIFNEGEGRFADVDFFKVFSCKSISGNLDVALEERNAIVLTESLAKKYFGDENAIGQELELGNDDGRKRVVSAVIEDFPEQSHLHFSYLLPLNTFSDKFRKAWRNWATYTYVRLHEGADHAAFNEKLTAEYERRYNAVGQNAIKSYLVPVKDIHLKTNFEKELQDNGNISYVYILFSVGIFVLLISCINFANLSVIKGLDRSREVGIRKTVGAQKSQLVVQFMAEHLIVIMLAAVIALLLLLGIAPYFKNFSGLDLPLSPFENVEVLLPLGILVLVLELVCGVYPALALSRYRPAQVLKSGAKSQLRQGSLGLMRKGLITLQFVISMVLICGSLLIYKQLNYIENKSLGFEKDQIILIDLDGEIQDNFGVFRDAIEQITGVLSVASSSHVPGYRIMNEPPTEVGVDRSDEQLIARLILTDNQFIETYGMEVIRGRDFNPELADGLTEYIVNEAAVPYIFEDRDPLTRQLVWGGDTGRVVGVVRDFNFQSLHTAVEPLVISSNTRWSRASIRFDPTRTEEVPRGIESAANRLFPNEPSIEYEFLSDRFATLYRAESKLKSLVWLFCIISIILTISGIFGMATYIARQKTREIAIRKVLGSNVRHLISLMSRSFVILLLFAILGAVPAAYYLLGMWLQGFAYQVPMGAFNFIVAVLGIFLLVIFSSGLVALRAVRANPTEALKGD